MKKHLIAAAVAAAVAVPAMAQNVTLSGNINVSLQRLDNGSDPAFMRYAESGIGGSDLFIQGSEDLGGGLKAAFIFRTGMDTSVATAPAFSKERAIELQGPFGNVRVGLTDVTSAQAIDSSVSFFGDYGFTPKIGTTAAAIARAEIGADKPGVVRWTSPNMSGLTLQLGVGNQQIETNITGANRNTRISGVYGTYAVGPATLYGSQTRDSQSGTSQNKDSRFGAKATFGDISVGAISANTDLSATVNDVKTMVANAALNLGGGLSAHIVFASQEIGSIANTASDGYTVGLKKDLSKRTTIYGAYTASDAGSAALFEMGGNGTYSVVGKKGTSVTAGIYHSF